MPFCSNSDDNMLKNIELFDKLSLRFNGRVLFIKDVIGDEICCWSFYGQGRKIAEVCCTSIVYATEKKQTKVRADGSGWPAWRVYLRSFHGPSGPAEAQMRVLEIPNGAPLVPPACRGSLAASEVLCPKCWLRYIPLPVCMQPAALI